MVGTPAMPPLIASLAHRLSPSTPMTLPQVLRLLPFAAFHLAALAIMIAIENGPVRMLVYLLTWGLINFVWLALLRRPAVAAGLSLTVFAAVIWVSRFKHQVLWMTANFMDLMIIDRRDRGVPLDDIAGGSGHRARHGRRRDPGPGAALAYRSLARPAADRGGECRRLLRRAGGGFVRVPARRGRGIRGRQQHFCLHALGRRGRAYPGDPRLSGSRRRGDRAPQAHR